MELTQRERLLILAAVAILGPLLIIRFVLFPIHEYQSNLTIKIEKLEKNIDQLNLLGQELRYLKREGRIKSISLSKKVDSILRQTNLKRRSRTVVEEQPAGGQRLVLKLDEINLTELANIVYRIEHNKPGIIIESIDINPSYQNKKLFRISLALISK